MSWLRRYFRPTWTRITGLVVGIGVCLGILVNFPVARTQLENSIDRVSAIVAALVPWIAFAGALFFSFILAGGIVMWEVDRRRAGPEKRRFICLRGALAEAREKLEESMSGFDPLYSQETSAQFQGRLEEVDALVESLADELKQLGIATPPVGNIHQTNEVHKWLKALPRLVGYSSRGDLDAAIRLGESLETDT